MPFVLYNHHLLPNRTLRASSKSGNNIFQQKGIKRAINKIPLVGILTEHPVFPQQTTVDIAKESILPNKPFGRRPPSAPKIAVSPKRIAMKIIYFAKGGNSRKAETMASIPKTNFNHFHSIVC